MTNVQNVQLTPLAALKPNKRNPRTHSKGQIREIANSILAFGFVDPIIADEQLGILSGDGRYRAGKLLGLESVPVIIVCGLSAAKKRALALAENKIAEKAGWDRGLLASEIPELAEMLPVESLDLSSVTGFTAAEIESLTVKLDEDSSDPIEDLEPTCCTVPVTVPGDYWHLGNHRLGCDDARNPDALDRLMGEARAAMCFVDPYDGAPDLGAHRGIAAHSQATPSQLESELGPSKFLKFLCNLFRAAVSASRDGAIHYVRVRWQDIGALLEAAAAARADALNIVVWIKSDGGDGALYRNDHEFIGVFRVGEPRPTTIDRQRRRRPRSTVWRYTANKPGLQSFDSRTEMMPVALVADAITDVTGRGDVVLAPSCGCGATILAAERTGRRAYALENEPRLVDLTIRRWQASTGGEAIHATLGQTFDRLRSTRHSADTR